jgi:hypothetical protein
VFAADCFMWKPSKRLLVRVVFESPLTMRSIAGKEAHAKAIIASVDTICQGLE